MQKATMSRRIEIAQFATLYFGGKASLQSEFKTCLTSYTWQKRIGKLLNTDPTQIDMSDKDEICLKLLGMIIFCQIFDKKQG